MRHPAAEVLFHHRFPTSTANRQNACHPFSTQSNGQLFSHNYVLVHNGWITNDYELEEAHHKLGISYVSEQPSGVFNDSEALLYDLALYLEGKQPELKARGAIAFVCVERDENGKPLALHFGRNLGAPLVMKYRPGRVLCLASEGKGESIKPDTLYTYTYATGDISQKPLTIPEYTYYTYTPEPEAEIPSATGWHYDFEDEEWQPNALPTEVAHYVNIMLEISEGDLTEATDNAYIDYKDKLDRQNTLELLCQEYEDQNKVNEFCGAADELLQISAEVTQARRGYNELSRRLAEAEIIETDRQNVARIAARAGGYQHEA